MAAHTAYTGKYFAMLCSTLRELDLFLITFSKLKDTIIKLIKIKIFPPNTAILLGVIPNSTIRKLIAESAMPLIIIVNKDRPNKRIELK